MITLKEKADTIKYLKSLVVKHQKYEFAAWLRDREKSILEEIGEVEDYSYTFDGKLNYNQYHYVLELISTYENKHNYNEQQFIEMVRKDCIHLIRDQKIDELFGES
jgi:replication-associated recombination protein RarA